MSQSVNAPPKDHCILVKQREQSESVKRLVLALPTHRRHSDPNTLLVLVWVEADSFLQLQRNPIGVRGAPYA